MGCGVSKDELESLEARVSAQLALQVEQINKDLVGRVDAIEAKDAKKTHTLQPAAQLGLERGSAAERLLSFFTGSKATGRNKIEAMFRHLDRSGSGDLYRDELVFGLRRAGIRLRRAESLRLFEHFDKDRTGKVSLPQFRIQLGQWKSDPQALLECLDPERRDQKARNIDSLDHSASDESARQGTAAGTDSPPEDQPSEPRKLGAAKLTSKSTRNRNAHGRYRRGAKPKGRLGGQGALSAANRAMEAYEQVSGGLVGMGQGVHQAHGWPSGVRLQKPARGLHKGGNGWRQLAPPRRSSQWVHRSGALTESTMSLQAGLWDSSQTTMANHRQRDHCSNHPGQLEQKAKAEDEHSEATRIRLRAAFDGHGQNSDAMWKAALTALLMQLDDGTGGLDSDEFAYIVSKYGIENADGEHVFEVVTQGREVVKLSDIQQLLWPDGIGKKDEGELELKQSKLQRHDDTHGPLPISQLDRAAAPKRQQTKPMQPNRGAQRSRIQIRGMGQPLAGSHHPRSLPD